MKKTKHRYDFIPLIKERKITNYSSREDSDVVDENAFAMNSAIKLGENFTISVQASSGHYCSPRKTLKNMSDYDEFEILISSSYGYIVLVNEQTGFNEYEAYIDEEYFKGRKSLHGAYVVNDGSCPVAGYVPGEAIDSIIRDLKFVINKLRSRNVLFEKWFSEKTVFEIK